jgi:hypothetical protein
MEPVEMDNLLGELRSLLACCQEFVGFLSRTVAEAVQTAPEPRSVLEALRGGTYANAIHELQAAYVSLERVYLEESVTKAIGLDAVVPVRSSMRCSHQALTRFGCMIMSTWLAFEVPPCIAATSACTCCCCDATLASVLECQPFTWNLPACCLTIHPRCGVSMRSILGVQLLPPA